MESSHGLTGSTAKRRRVFKLHFDNEQKVWNVPLERGYEKNKGRIAKA